MYIKSTLNPIERKSSATCTKEIIQVDINPKNAVHMKLVLIFIEIQESQQLMMMSSIQCWKKFCYHNMNVSSWEILIFQHRLDTAETNSCTRQQTDAITCG